MMRCMLHEKDLPKRFWGKAANTIMCLQNRISTKAVKDLTPFEVCMLEETEDEQLEESEDERQDVLVDDAPVRGGAFGDREKQNLGVGWSTSKQKDYWSKMDVQKKAWSLQHLNKEEC